MSKTFRNEKKILIISKDYPDIIGGVSDYTYNPASELSYLNQIFVLTSADDCISGKLERSVKIYPRVRKWNIFCLYPVLKEIRELKPDIILLQYVSHMYCSFGLPFYISLLAIIVNLQSYKLITNFHEVSLRLDFITAQRFLLLSPYKG